MNQVLHKKQYQRQWRLNHPSYNKEWRKKNPEKIKNYLEQQKKKFQTKYKTDPAFREKIRNKYRLKTYKKLQDSRIQILKIIQMKGKCERCGFDDVRALVIHHHFGNANKENWFQQSKDILEGRIPYSILCANCHMIIHNPRKIIEICPK